MAVPLLGLLAMTGMAYAGDRIANREKYAAANRINDNIERSLGLLDDAEKIPLAPGVLSPDEYIKQSQNPYRKLQPLDREMIRGMVAGGDFANAGKALGMDSAPGVGGFKDLNEYLKAKQATRKAINTDVASSRESLRKFQQATNIIKSRMGEGETPMQGIEKMSGGDDTVLIKAFASMILPGEAVMEGDIAAIVNQSGLPGTINSYLQAFKGKGQLGADQRREIYRAMGVLARQAKTENDEIRAQYKTDIERGGFPQEAMFRPSLWVDPLSVPDVPGAQVSRVPGAEVIQMNGKNYKWVGPGPEDFEEVTQ